MDTTKASFCERLLSMFNLLTSKKDEIAQVVKQVAAQVHAQTSVEAASAQAPVAPPALVPDEKHLIEQSLIAENSKYAPDNVETKI